ncbi:hypothetical protein DFJ58DRAFT_876181 [Suillus subalutaceus]|uniref:uncharacterized protein n=1 Tax=Suillus subalutaceus TaxID=48586 RepID=UPI001B86ED5A|nr:uncharacterized protein DFJ58DRAFT_876181 [Suillus subalutaceus]KAG1828899.1 hypothetical protein DFJ58DRAFT_876181 [Suillus subalutaceus]
MPDYPGLRHFKKGISMVKQWTGTEHKEMQRVFVGLLAGAVPSCAALLDFSYYAQASTTILIFPNYISSLTTVQSILLFGATDALTANFQNVCTSTFAKEVYRASNKRDYEEQMALWLQRQEAVFLHEMEGPDTVPVNTLPILPEQRTVHSLAKTPAYPQRSVQHLPLSCFLRNHMPHAIITPGLQDRFDVFRQVVITAPPNPLISESPRQWRVRATPEVLPGRGRKPGSPANNGIQPRTLEGMRVGQVRVIFTLPRQFGTYSRALAYIEWFTPLREPDRSSGLHQCRV